jgi:hypothetical protein
MRNKKITRNIILSCLVAGSLFIIKCKKESTSESSATRPAIPAVQVSNSLASAVTFIHPGVLNTQSSLSLIASQVISGNSARTAAYEKVTEFIKGHKYPISFPSTVVVGSDGATTSSKKQIRDDAELVYATALEWAETGNIVYADKAIAILNGWSYNFKKYALLNSKTNVNQPDLEASWTTPSFVAAAEILRYYQVNGKSAGWAAADINQFSTYLNIVLTNYIVKVPDYSNNWDATSGYAQMAIGVFLNNVAIYQNGENFIKHYLPIVIEPDGTLPELCERKDCVHYQYSLTAFSYAAEIARIQGDNSIWAANAKLISAGYDFMRKAYARETGCNYCKISSPVYPGTEVAYNYYKTSNLLYLRGLQAPLGVPEDNTFLGFTTYTDFNEPSL